MVSLWVTCPSAMLLQGTHSSCLLCYLPGLAECVLLLLRLYKVVYDHLSGCRLITNRICSTSMLIAPVIAEEHLALSCLPTSAPDL